MADVFVAPWRGLALAVERRSYAAPILVATAASLLLAAVLVPRLDDERAVVERLDREAAKAPPGTQTTPHQREEAIATSRKVGAIGAWAGALFGPAAAAVGSALALWMAFRFLGARTSLASMLSATAWGLLPASLGALLRIPGLLRVRAVAPHDLARSFPSSLAALLPAGAKPPLSTLAGSIELFALWSLVLVALGASRAARVPRGLAFTVAFALWLAYLAIFRVAIPSFTSS